MEHIEIYGKAIDDAAEIALSDFEHKFYAEGNQPRVKELLAFCEGFAAGWMGGYMYQGKANE